MNIAFKDISNESLALIKKHWTTITLILLIPILIEVVFFKFINLKNLIDWVINLTSEFGFGSDEYKPYYSLIENTFKLSFRFVVGFPFFIFLYNFLFNISFKREDKNKNLIKVVNFSIYCIFEAFLTFVGLLLFIFPGIYFLIKLLPAKSLIIDKNLTPIAAIRQSFRITKNFTGDILYNGIITSALSFVITILCSIVLSCLSLIIPIRMFDENAFYSLLFIIPTAYFYLLEIQSYKKITQH